MAQAASGGERMTYEEAIKHFKSLQKRYTKEHNGRMCEKVNLALEALEKQIPKKPTMGKYGHTECACCGWIVESFCGDLEQYPFCPNCGQAIDWED